MGLKVIGAGLGRTGTTSLKLALEQLQLGPCYHMVECFSGGPEHWQLWVDALTGKPDWDRVFDGFQSTLDFPASTSYQALAAHYPQAKVILTVRDPEGWYESTQKTIFSPRWIEYLKTVEMGRYMQLTVNDYFQDRMHDKSYLIECFKAHIETVRCTISASQLLIFDVKDGWEPLCQFLELPIPDGEFPCVNDTQATQNGMNGIMSKGVEAIFGSGRSHSLVSAND
jgi:hypothetical protein